MKDVGDMLVGKGIREKYSVIIGGAPITPDITEEMGANAYGSNAAGGVEKCKMLLGKPQNKKLNFLAKHPRRGIKKLSF
jgi:5-methyltetrahydrofolate--homocysteine methyltransferase|tara:strand:+ start:460 stop:696 length:237 start_codon:yes stop_codon:yes gene_type:complete